MTCVQRRSAHRIRGTTHVVGTGGAVRPVTLSRWTDPTIAPAFDGLKYFRLSQGRVFDRSLLGSSFLGPPNERFNRRLSPPGFPQCPTVRELRGAVAPSTEMSRIAIYLPDRCKMSIARQRWSIGARSRSSRVLLIECR